MTEISSRNSHEIAASKSTKKLFGEHNKSEKLEENMIQPEFSHKRKHYS